MRVVSPAERGIVDRRWVLQRGRDGAHGVLGVEGAHVGQAARVGGVVTVEVRGQRGIASCCQGAVDDVGSYGRGGEVEGRGYFIISGECVPSDLIRCAFPMRFFSFTKISERQVCIATRNFRKMQLLNFHLLRCTQPAIEI